MKTPPVCNYEGSDYQQSFWDEGGRQYEDLAEAAALRQLLPPSGNLMLELGAGAGRNTLRYKGYRQVVVLDYSKTQLEQAKARLGSGAEYIYVAADIYRLPFKNGLFDGATMIRTLHHMREPELALSRIERTLAPGAVFILEYANKLNLKSIGRYFLGKQRWSPFSHEQVEFVELNFNFHPAHIRQIVSKLGLKVAETRTVSHFRIGFLKRVFPARFLAAVDGFIQPTGNLWQLTPSVFLRLEKSGEQSAAREGLLQPLDIFACPDCGGALAGENELLRCSACDKAWSAKDGIYDFRQPV